MLTLTSFNGARNCVPAGGPPRRLIRSALLGALLVSLAACVESVLDPAVEWQPPVSGTPTPPPPAPTPIGPSAAPTGAYDRISPSYIPGTQRYVFFDDGRFSLQYTRPDWGFFEYKGTYSLADSLLTFDWEGWSTAGAWGAEGMVRGDTLTVRYNIIMSLSDFEDGVFVRSAP